jgi:hypothetical protein
MFKPCDAFSLNLAIREPSFAIDNTGDITNLQHGDDIDVKDWQHGSDIDVRLATWWRH